LADCRTTPSLVGATCECHSRPWVHSGTRCGTAWRFEGAEAEKDPLLPTSLQKILETNRLLETNFVASGQKIPRYALPGTMTGFPYFVGRSDAPSFVARAPLKQSIPEGSATPDCADLVQMFAVISTAFGLS
jgi:hypothetical protein